METPRRKTTLNLNDQTGRRGRGFTLIEILIVVAIISIVVSLGLPAIERVTYQRVAATARKFVGIIRTIRNDALLLNTIYRLTINLDKQQWWVESQKQFSLLGETNESNKKRGTKKVGDSQNFSMAQKYSKEPMPLPGGVVIEGVLKEREGNIQSGLVYVHFFPNGFNDHSILYINKESAKSVPYSLILRPTAGRIEVVRARIQNFEAYSQ